MSHLRGSFEKEKKKITDKLNTIAEMAGGHFCNLMTVLAEIMGATGFMPYLSDALYIRLYA